jgi:hypothetical protein
LHARRLEHVERADHVNHGGGLRFGDRPRVADAGGQVRGDAAPVHGGLDRLVPELVQAPDDVGADEAGATGDHDPH